MAAEGHFSEAAASVDSALSAWRQGDFVLGPQSFLKRLDPTLPLVRGEQDCDADSDIYEQQVDGLVVVRQTCDIVRAAQKRPYVEVCPLVRIENAALMEEISKCRRPAYAVVPGSEAACLVADLDRTMTVEKPVVSIGRTTGLVRVPELRPALRP